MNNQPSKTAEELLLLQEARGLQVPAIARIIFCILGIASTLISTAMPTVTFLFILFSGLVFVAANAYFFMFLRRMQGIKVIGPVGIALDSLAIIMFPIIGYNIINQPSLSPALLTKSGLVPFCLIFLIIDSLALIPLYPLILAGTGIVVHFAILVLAIQHTGTIWSSSDIEILTGPASSMPNIFLSMIFLIIAGSTLATLARSARKTVIKAVTLETEKYYLQREQSELLSEAKIGALGQLVAGISHEMNNPLGVVKSITQTWKSSVDRIRQSLETAADTGSVDKKTEKIITLLENNSATSLEATQRLESTLKRLRSFARLDEAEVKKADVNEILDNTIALIPQDTIGQTNVRKNYGELPQVVVSPGHLNQVFMTILTNAFEAIDGDGTVSITTKKRNEKIIVRITDTGRGIPAEELDSLFNIRMRPKGSRVKAGFGLAACHSIITQHLGEINVESDIGKGTTFTVILPVEYKESK